MKFCLKILYLASLILCFSAKSQEQQEESQDKWLSCFSISEKTNHSDCVEFNIKDLHYNIRYYTHLNKKSIKIRIYNNEFDLVQSFNCTEIEEGKKCKSWLDNL